MGVLVDGFGGKVNGELIRAADWNGMLAAVETLVTDLQQTVDARLTPLETSMAALGARVTTLETQVADLTTVAATLRSRFRRLNLTSGSARFAIGQRGTITATVTSFDGAPLSLPDAAARPWVDFVTPWGTLLPAPGFVTRSGVGGRTVSVQVNAGGQARVLLQAHHATHFSEAEQVQVESAMATRIQVGGQDMSVAESILAGATPASANVQPAFRAITQAYSSAGANTMQRYLDSYYVQAPSRVATQIGPIVGATWNDYLTTVLAFVKPDADPVSPDGAMAAGAIQVTFRDWVTHWIVNDFFADLTDPIREYRETLPGLIRTDLRRSVDDVLDEIDDRVRGGGILGGQRQYEAAIGAVRGMSVSNPAPFFGDAVEAVANGIAVQRAVSFGQAVTPGSGTAPETARAIAGTSAKATDEAARVGTSLSGEFQAALGQATQSLRDQVRTDQQVFQAQLLRDDGPIAVAQREARDVRGALETVNRALTAKADLQFVTDFVRQRG
jgi:uncharacterized coiled-coil protein SlyX